MSGWHLNGWSDELDRQDKLKKDSFMKARKFHIAIWRSLLHDTEYEFVCAEPGDYDPTLGRLDFNVFESGIRSDSEDAEQAARDAVWEHVESIRYFGTVNIEVNRYFVQ